MTAYARSPLKQLDSNFVRGRVRIVFRPRIAYFPFQRGACTTVLRGIVSTPTLRSASQLTVSQVQSPAAAAAIAPHELAFTTTFVSIGPLISLDYDSSTGANTISSADPALFARARAAQPP